METPLMSWQKWHEHATACDLPSYSPHKNPFFLLCFSKPVTNLMTTTCSGSTGTVSAWAELSSCHTKGSRDSTPARQAKFTDTTKMFKVESWTLRSKRSRLHLRKWKPGYSKTLSLKSRVILVLVKTYGESLKPDI